MVLSKPKSVKFVILKVKYIVSAALVAPSEITKIKHYKMPLRASPNSPNITIPALLGVCEGMSQQVKVGYFK